jgi:hypothetical protein
MLQRKPMPPGPGFQIFRRHLAQKLLTLRGSGRNGKKERRERIAIPQLSLYRTRSYNSSAQTDLRNAATAQEAYFIDESIYCSAAATLTSSYRLYLSHGVQFHIDSADTGTYVMRAWHPSGDASFILRGPGGSISKM